MKVTQNIITEKKHRPNMENIASEFVKPHLLLLFVSVTHYHDRILTIEWACRRPRTKRTVTSRSFVDGFKSAFGCITSYVLPETQYIYINMKANQKRFCSGKLKKHNKNTYLQSAVDWVWNLTLWHSFNLINGISGTRVADFENRRGERFPGDKFYRALSQKALLHRW